MVEPQAATTKTSRPAWTLELFFDQPQPRAAFMKLFPGSFAAALLVLIGGFLEPPWADDRLVG